MHRFARTQFGWAHEMSQCWVVACCCAHPRQGKWWKYLLNFRVKLSYNVHYADLFGFEVFQALDFRPQKNFVFWKSWHQLDQPPSGAGVQPKKKDHNSLPFPKSSVIFVLASTSCCSNSYWAAFTLTDEDSAPFVSALRTVLWEMKPIHK